MITSDNLSIYQFSIHEKNHVSKYVFKLKYIYSCIAVIML